MSTLTARCGIRQRPIAYENEYPLEVTRWRDLPRKRHLSLPGAAVLLCSPILVLDLVFDLSAQPLIETKAENDQDAGAMRT